jgi:hypothetical protein
LSRSSICICHQNPAWIPLRPMHTTCPAHVIPLHLIILIVYGEGYNLGSFSLIQFSPTLYYFILIRSKYYSDDRQWWYLILYSHIAGCEQHFLQM